MTEKNLWHTWPEVMIAPNGGRFEPAGFYRLNSTPLTHLNPIPTLSSWGTHCPHLAVRHVESGRKTLPPLTTRVLLHSSNRWSPVFDLLEAITPDEQVIL